MPVPVIHLQHYVTVEPFTSGDHRGDRQAFFQLKRYRNIENLLLGSTVLHVSHSTTPILPYRHTWTSERRYCLPTCC